MNQIFMLSDSDLKRGDQQAVDEQSTTNIELAPLRVPLMGLGLWVNKSTGP